MARPLFSIVTAVYNVEPYLPEFIASVEAQRFDLARVQVIAVDDGSTDGSLAILEAWQARRPELVTVLSKRNGGQASARNLGMERATGGWITFPDPDDMLDRDYLAIAARYIEGHPDLAILGANPIVLNEIEGQGGEHPRARQYDGGNRVVDLRREPNVFPGGPALCFCRLDLVRSGGVRFDEDLKPVFEDVHFTAQYLLSLPEPRVGLLTDLRYIYRKRLAGDSTLQRGWSHPGRFTTVLERGHLDLLRRATAPDGSITPWVQQLVIYDLSWYLEEADKTESRNHVPPELVPAFEALFCEIVRQLDPDVVRDHRAHTLKPRWVDLLAHGCRDESWSAATIDRVKVDRAMRLQRVVLRYGGATPRTEILVDGRPVAAAYSKIRKHDYFGRVSLLEQISWVPIGARLDVLVDGVAVPERRGRGAGSGASRPKSTRRPSSVARLGGFVRRRLRARPLSRRGRKEGWRIANAPMRLLAGTPVFARYRRAWVLTDRVDEAGDNAERLFDFLRSERPQVNAWFTVDRDTPAWNRMRRAGVPRLVARGSLRWKFLMLNCAWLVSSHADKSIVDPPQVLSIAGRRTWRFAFLQHGVTKDDISTWLNKREFELVVTSTDAETASIVDDRTPYIYTAKEVQATGMPRYDRLLRKGAAVPVEARDTLLVAPTWRLWLAVNDSRGGPTRSVDDSIWDSEYLTSWKAVLESRRIADEAAAAGLRLAFMPHPNLKALLPTIALPDGVRVLSFADVDPQEVYAHTALLVTDYSSVAFDVAALDRPVVYFQFDRALVFGGGHIWKPGYFDYERDGFGPVATTLEATEEAVLAAIANGPRPSAAYQARIDATFTNRDGHACARVADAIEARSRPYRSGTGPRTVSTGG